MADDKDDSQTEIKRRKKDFQSAVGNAPQHVAVFILQGHATKTKEECTSRIHKERIVLGSVESADLQIDMGFVSPIHAVVEYQNGSFTIFDLASEFGTEVNGEKIVQKQLNDGDSIEMGSATYKFFSESLREDREDLNPEAQAVFGERPTDHMGRNLFFRRAEDLKPLILSNKEDAEDIFEHPSPQDRAVEVVLAWNNSVLDVEHFRSGESVSVGPSHGSDFVIPDLLKKKKFQMVSFRGGESVLNLDPSMDGVVHRDGKVTPIDELRSNLPGKGADYQVALKENDFAKIRLGDLVFYISTTQAPPTLKRRRMTDRDPLFFRIMASSLALSMALMFTMLNMTVTQKLEVEELPERIATILYQPEKYNQLTRPPRLKGGKAPRVTKTSKKKTVTKIDFSKPQPKKKIGATTQKKRGGRKVISRRQGREGEGARAKGAKGRRGSKTAPVRGKGQRRALRPSTRPGSGAGGGKSQVPGPGNLDSLKGFGQKFENLLSGSTQKLGKVGSNLQGFGGFDSRGSGGLAISGQGVGGGGSAATLGGLGKKGVGGGRVGTGIGAAGKGSGIVGGKARVVLRTGGPEETIVMGAIDAAAVERALLAHKDEFRFCYEKEINAGRPDLQGRVTTSFVIGPRGRVTRAGIAATSLNNKSAERCIVKVIRRIQFPRPKGGGIVQVKYPFRFRPVGG